MTRNQIIELYTATFNRAADAAGVAYWETQDLTQEQMANSFVISEEATALYPATQTNTEYVTAIYTNLFGRTPDDEGLAYWVGKLDDGTDKKETMVAAFINGADASDKSVLDNKTAVSVYAVDKGLSEANAKALSLASVTADAATINTAKSSVDTAIEEQQLATIDGETFVLTTSSTGDSFVGTEKNDLFTAAAGTLQKADTILDSSSTDADILNATVTSAGIDPRVQNVETINVNGKYATTGIDLASISGTKDLNLDTNIIGGTATVLNAGTLNAVNINAGTNIGTLSVTATASGTRDAVVVDAGSAKTVTIIGGAGTDTFETTVASGTTLNLNTASANIDTHTVHTSGGKLTMNGTNAAKTVTIDNSTAALELTLTDGQTIVGTGTTSKWDITGNADVTFKVADDTTATAITDLEDINLVNSGSGKVTVEIADTASTTVANLTSLVADEIKFTKDGTAAIVADVNEGTVVNLAADATKTGAVTLDVGTSTLNTAYTAGEGTLLLNVSDNQTSNAVTIGAGVGTLILNATPDEATDTDADANGTAETNITITDLNTAASTNTETIVIQGSEDLTITTLTNDATASVVSASSMTGDLTIGTTTAAGTFVLGSGTNNVTVGNVASTIHGGSGVDTITGGTAADTINGGAGDDIIAGGATAANTIDAGAGDDIVTVTAKDTVTLGSGSDTVISAVDVDYTIKDLNAAEDTVVITGTATAGVDLTNVAAPVSGGYKVGTASVTYTATGETATDISSYVQLGNADNAYTVATGTTVVAGAKDDVLNIATTTTGTVTTGAGSDTVILNAGTSSAVTVTDFTVGSDKVIVTGAATANATVDLGSVTPNAGAYTIDTNAVVTLKDGATAFTTTDLTTMVQLGVSATDAYDISGTALSVTGGTFDDFIDASGMTGAATINFIDNGGMDTVIAFTTTSDKVSFDGMTGITATTGTNAATNTAKVSDASDGAVYVFGDATAAHAGTAKVDTFTVNKANGITADTILADVADFLEANLGEADGENYVTILNDGTDSYAYLVNADADGIQADNIELIGHIVGEQVVFGDIA